MGGERNDEQIVQLITGCQHSLLVYLLGLLGSQELAEETLQETNLVMWRKRNEYSMNTNFPAWARHIAYFEACKSRSRRSRKMPVFSEVFMQEISPELELAIQTPNRLEVFLKECLDLLDDGDRDMLAQRYADGATTQSVALALKQSIRSAYRNLERIHERLFKCISEKIDQDGA